MIDTTLATIATLGLVLVGVWLSLGLILLIVCLRDGGNGEYHLGHYLLVILAGPPLMALLLIDGLISRGPRLS